MSVCMWLWPRAMLVCYRFSQLFGLLLTLWSICNFFLKFPDHDHDSQVSSFYFLPSIPSPSNCSCGSWFSHDSTLLYICTCHKHIVCWWAWMSAWIRKCLCMKGLHHFCIFHIYAIWVSACMCHSVCTPGYQEEWFGDSVFPHLLCSYCIMVTTWRCQKMLASPERVGGGFPFQLWGFPWVFQNHGM